MVEAPIIDEINILQASFEAMRKALAALNKKPDLILVDGKFKIPKLITTQYAIIDGDNLSITIAAASIIAKVTRDRLMAFYENNYPGYDLIKNKGYGTKTHREALIKLGHTSIHRKSFAGVLQ